MNEDLTLFLFLLWISKLDSKDGSEEEKEKDCVIDEEKEGRTYSKDEEKKENNSKDK